MIFGSACERSGPIIQPESGSFKEPLFRLRFEAVRYFVLSGLVGTAADQRRAGPLLAHRRHPFAHRRMGRECLWRTLSHMRACDTAERQAATAEVYSAYDPTESDQDRQWLAEAPLCLGDRRGLRTDLYDHLPRAVHHQYAGPLPSEPPGVWLELLRD